MRIAYHEGGDEDFPGQTELFWANIARSLHGKKGQAVLRELRDALVAMPDKRLIAGHVACGGDVCAVGALIVARRTSDGSDRRGVADALWDLTGPGCAGTIVREDTTPAPWSCGHRRNEHDDDGCRRCREDLERAKQKDRDLGAYGLCARYVEPDIADDDRLDTVEFATKEGLPHLVAWRLVELNDIELETLTLEERYARVLAWVSAMIREEVRRG